MFRKISNVIFLQTFIYKPVFKFYAVLNWADKAYACNLAAWHMLTSPGKPIFTVVK